MTVVQVTVRDLYNKKDLGLFTHNFTAVIPYHGVLALKLTPSKCVPVLVFIDRFCLDTVSLPACWNGMELLRLNFHPESALLTSLSLMVSVL